MFGTDTTDPANNQECFRQGISGAFQVYSTIYILLPSMSRNLKSLRSRFSVF